MPFHLQDHVLSDSMILFDSMMTFLKVYHFSFIVLRKLSAKFLALSFHSSLSDCLLRSSNEFLSGINLSGKAFSLGGDIV